LTDPTRPEARQDAHRGLHASADVPTDSSRPEARQDAHDVFHASASDPADPVGSEAWPDAHDVFDASASDPAGPPGAEVRRDGAGPTASHAPDRGTGGRAPRASSLDVPWLDDEDTDTPAVSLLDERDPDAPPEEAGDDIQSGPNPVRWWDDQSEASGGSDDREAGAPTASAWSTDDRDFANCGEPEEPRTPVAPPPPVASRKDWWAAGAGPSPASPRDWWEHPPATVRPQSAEDAAEPARFEVPVALELPAGEDPLEDVAIDGDEPDEDYDDVLIGDPDPARAVAVPAAPAPVEPPVAVVPPASPDAGSRDPVAVEVATELPIAAPPPAGPATEAALRAAVEAVSREVIERIAWEIVPQLAETIVREHLERLLRAREDGRT
jgi:hypothetical protein